MENYKFHSYIKLSYFRLSLLIINTLLIISYANSGIFNWAIYLLGVVAIFEFIHVVDFFTKRSYIALDGDILTVNKLLSGKKTYNLKEYEQFKGRQRNGKISSLAAYKIDNPKQFVFLMNVYQKSLNEFFNVVAPPETNNFDQIEEIEESE
jgi:hypothetical protein